MKPQSQQQPQQQNQSSQFVSEDHKKLDNEQNTFSYQTSVFTDQFHMPQVVAATSSDHSMMDEGNLWGSLWSLDDHDPHHFGGCSEQRTASNVSEKFNGCGIDAPFCGSWDYSYNGFNTRL